jgi:lipopolysaccharide export system protein LptC
MKLKSNTLFSLGLTAGLAALTFWLEWTVHAPKDAATDGGVRVPEFVVDRVSATSMDATGRAESLLSAERMLYYPDEEITEVEEPRLTQFPEKGPPVRVSAERGTVNKEGDEVRLYGKVVVTREPTGDRPELRMETTYLQVFPKTDIARTPEPVLITQGTSKLAGVGMEYDNAKRQLELKARVSGSFEPGAATKAEPGAAKKVEPSAPRKAKPRAARRS